MPEKVFLSPSSPQSEEAPGNGQKHEPLSLSPPTFALSSHTVPLQAHVGVLTAFRRRPGPDRAQEKHGSCQDFAWLLSISALYLPCLSVAWPRRCPLSIGEQGGARPSWLGQCDSPPTLMEGAWGWGVPVCVCVNHTHRSAVL